MNTSKLLALSAFALLPTLTMAANVTCQINKTTGQMEATRAWRNTLGAEADRICSKEQARMTAEAAAAAAAAPAQYAQPQRLPPGMVPMQQYNQGTPNPYAPVNPYAPAPAPAAFVAYRADRVMSTVFLRWAATAGWAFTLDDWTAPKDLPIVTDASLPGDFKEAVRELVGTSELTDMPLQPCFYSNKVLRIIKISDSCSHGSDKTTTN